MFRIRRRRTQGSADAQSLLSGTSAPQGEAQAAPTTAPQKTPTTALQKKAAKRKTALPPRPVSTYEVTKEKTTAPGRRAGLVRTDVLGRQVYAYGPRIQQGNFGKVHRVWCPERSAQPGLRAAKILRESVRTDIPIPPNKRTQAAPKVRGEAEALATLGWSNVEVLRYPNPEGRYAVRKAAVIMDLAAGSASQVMGSMASAPRSDAIAVGLVFAEKALEGINQLATLPIPMATHDMRFDNMLVMPNGEPRVGDPGLFSDARSPSSVAPAFCPPEAMDFETRRPRARLPGPAGGGDVFRIGLELLGCCRGEPSQLVSGRLVTQPAGRPESEVQAVLQAELNALEASPASLGLGNRSSAKAFLRLLRLMLAWEPAKRVGAGPALKNLRKQERMLKPGRAFLVAWAQEAMREGEAASREVEAMAAALTAADADV